VSYPLHMITSHIGCPLDPVDKSKRWCSTKTDENGVHIGGGGSWGYCTEECPPEISPDEISVGGKAKTDVQTETCDVKACNGFTLVTQVFDEEVTFGECQFPAGINGTKDDYYCFVNADTACTDKEPYGNPEDGRFFSIEACETATLPRFFSFGVNMRFGGGSRRRGGGGWGGGGRRRGGGGWGGGGGSSLNIGFGFDFGK